MLADEVARVLSAEPTGDLSKAPLDDIRAQRSACAEVETQASYLRRLVQGRLDIVSAERRRRAAGEEATDLPTLLEELPGILSENVHAGGFGRLPTQIEPTSASEITAELDAVADATVVSSLPDLSDEELSALAERLGQFEQQVSATRQALHARIDALQGELTRRYKSGEATVDALLQP